MKPKFYCDENITRKLENTFEILGYEVDSVRNQKLFGMENGNLVNHLNMNKQTLITFDRDFLNKDILIHHGVIILDVHPNRDEFSVPLLKEFKVKK
ncbi:MAG: hypothetical protein GF317_00975 [Candidatus Lokiarchaeota archaeon]|nr:hypothetical protein [Candidatus Lokiarchaeota archaeon]MBD3198531.1 hypothetical protein [Candidatus Lokiarchaeota archaeon]